MLPLIPHLDIQSLAEALSSGNRRALAKAITLVESRRADDADKAQELLNAILPFTGKSRRIGITGVPGVGKSTFIEAFGLMLIAEGKKVAVLAIDPSSERTGGSILGDKTRMMELSRSNYSFIRPSPAGQTLGGVARRTRETMLLCEAAGFDIVLVETVGVGQSETAVASMEIFLVLALAGAGDELQGMKRGIMELADGIAINKAEESNRAAAERAAQHIRNGLHFAAPKYDDWQVPVLLCSAVERNGLEEIWATVTQFAEENPARITQLRRSQAVRWMRETVNDGLQRMVEREPELRILRRSLEQRVVDEALSPSSAAMQFLEAVQRTLGAV